MGENLKYSSGIDVRTFNVKFWPAFFRTLASFYATHLIQFPDFPVRHPVITEEKEDCILEVSIPLEPLEGRDEGTVTDHWVVELVVEEGSGPGQLEVAPQVPQGIRHPLHVIEENGEGEARAVADF